LENTEKSKDGESIALPELLLGPIKYSIGYAQQVIQAPQTLGIIHEESIPISARIYERCVTLENNERIIVTERTSVKRPNDVDGVIRITSTSVGWLNHIKLDNALNKIRNNGLSNYANNVCSTWVDSVRYVSEKTPIVDNSDRGLRPPQLGALFSVGSHWSLSNAPATVVMPTGTGKT
jgi:hypothetical protein